jgi:hypothetical protein
MSDGDGDKAPTPLRPLPGIEATHGPLVFQVRLFADGHLDWKAPQSQDLAMNEILFRGYFDKVRDTILEYLKSVGGSRIIS